MNLFKRILIENWQVQNAGDVYRIEGDERVESDVCVLGATGHGNSEDIAIKMARGRVAILGLDLLKLIYQQGEWGQTTLRAGVWEDRCTHCHAIKPHHERGCAWKVLFRRIREIETMPDPITAMDQHIDSILGPPVFKYPEKGVRSALPMPKTRKKANKAKHKARVRATSKKLEAERKTEQRKAKKAAA